MTITQIIIFVRVAETLNFTQAAQELHMTQPAVSHAIASIEGELDVTLLLRDRKRGVKLTDIGQKVLVHFRGILQHMERAQQQIAAEKGFEVGTLSIGAFPSASAYFLPPIIQHIRKLYPNLVFDLHEGSTNEVKDWVHTKKIEAGIILLPDQEVDIIPLYHDHMMILLPDGHPLHEEKTIDIRQLDGLEMVLCKGGHEVAIMDAFQSENSHLHIKFTTHNVSTLVSMVRLGLGIGIVSSLAMTMYPHELTVREVTPRITREIGIAVPSLHHASRAVQMFLRTAQDLFVTK